jgi:hypothetical protein
MNTKPSSNIGPAGRWLIFSGVPMALLGALLTITLRHGLSGIANTFGQNAEPYILFFAPVVVCILGGVIYQRWPKRLVIPSGIIGWTIGLSLIYHYFWFGPGSYGHR